jgi:hypothetical protein
LFEKCNWVCTICGQDFTRRTSGNRHNSNLRNGMAKLVRPFDYITGRLNGQIASPVRYPWAYRRYKRNYKNHNRLDNHGLQINRSFIEENNDMRWNNSSHAVVHERNLPKKKKDNSIRALMMTYLPCHEYPDLEIGSQSWKRSKRCCPNTVVLATQISC